VEKYKHILTALFLFAMVFVLFGGTMQHNFNSDDYLAVYHALRNPTSSPAEAFAEFARPSWGLYYRPVIKFLFEALAKSFGLWPGGYHLVSLACYALLCIEVYLIALLITDRWHAAAASAILFMTSGAHGEAIFWISSLNGVVENIITLASLIVFIMWRQKDKAVLHPLSVLLFILALLTKESAISLPIILMLYDFFLGGEFRWAGSTKRTAKSCWPFVVAGAVFILIRGIVMRRVELPPPLVTFEWRMLLAGPWHAVVMTLSPINWAHALSWFDDITRTGAVLYLFISVVLLALTVVPIVLRRYRVAFLALWIMAGASPMFALGLAPSERHIVFSSVGAAILISVVFFKLAEWTTRGQKPSAVLVGLVLVAAFAVPSFNSLRQTQRLWKRASMIASSVLEQTTAIHPAPQDNSTLFFLNVPDSIDGALVFRFGNIEHALRLYYGNDSLKAVRIVTLDKVPSRRLARAESAYFSIAAMGGHIYVPREPAGTRWRKLESLEIIRRNSHYIDDWERYKNAPLFVYAEDTLRAMPPADLEKVLKSLYSLR